jgi:hypothetical protein
MIQTALAAFGGLLASQHKVLDYTQTWNIISNNYISAYAEIDANIAYTTTYVGGLNANGDPSETVGLNTYGTAIGSLNFEFFQWYQYQIDYQFTGFNISPYVQQFWWTAPLESSNGFSYGTTAWYNINIGSIQTTIWENMKVCGDSVVDAID